MAKAVTKKIAALGVVSLFIGIGIGTGIGRFTVPPEAVSPGLTGEVTIGALLSLTGGLETYGQNAKVTIEFAVSEINEYLKKIGAGWTLKVRVENSEAKPEIALEKLELLHAAGIKFVICAHGSGCMQSMKAYANANEILIFGCTSTRIGLNNPDDFLYRFCPTETSAAAVTARMLVNDGVTHAIYVYREDTWGRGLYDAIEYYFEKLGGNTVVTIPYDQEAVDFGPVADTIESEVQKAIEKYGVEKVGVCYMMFGEAVAILSALSERSPEGWGIKWYGSCGTALSAKMVEDPTVAAWSATTASRHPVFSPTHSDKWKKVHDHVYGVLGRSPDAYAYAAYDTTWALAYSLLAVDDYDGKAVKEILPDITETLFGSSGWVVLNEDGDRVASDYDLWAITQVDTEYKWEAVARYVYSTDSIVEG